MSASHTSTSLAGFVAEAPVKLDIGVRRRVSSMQVLQNRSEQLDLDENELRRRARLQGLALMFASSVLSVAAVYGIWTVLSSVI